MKLSSEGAPLLLVGVGRIGLPIAKRLLASGQQLAVYDLDEEAVSAACSNGASAASRSSIATWQYTRILFCMPDPGAVRAFLDLWESKAPAGTIICDFTTISSSQACENARVLAGIGADYIDAPITGGVHSVLLGELCIMTSGPRSAFNRIASLLKKIGNVEYVGPQGLASQLKAVIQVTYLMSNVAFTYAHRFAVRAGVPDDCSLRVLSASAAAHPLIIQRLRDLQGSSRAAFTVSRALKDVQMLRTIEADDPFERIRVLAATILQQGIHEGFGNQDIFALAKSKL